VGRQEARGLIEAWIKEAWQDGALEYSTLGLPQDWPLEVWQVLVEEYPEHRYWAAHQVHCPEPIVRRLAEDEEWRVRARIAAKRNLPRDLFAVLARDSDEAVRRPIACNQKSPLELVEALTRDPVASVARVAVYNLEKRRAAGKRGAR
jgi:hypothetical protein